MIFAGFTLPGLLLMGVFYGRVAAHPETASPHFVVKWSMVFFVFVLLTSAVAVALVRSPSS
jgi:hypothetical protein